MSSAIRNLFRGRLPQDALLKDHVEDCIHGMLRWTAQSRKFRSDIDSGIVAIIGEVFRVTDGTTELLIERNYADETGAEDESFRSTLTLVMRLGSPSRPSKAPSRICRSSRKLAIA